MFAGITVNWWAVIVGAIVCMVTGMIWYNPKVFGMMWMKANGLTMDDAKKGDMTKMYGLQFIGALVMVWVLAMFVGYVNPLTTQDGFMLALWLWLGFMVAGTVGLYIFPPKPFNLFFMDSIYRLINILLVAWLLMSWK